MSRDAGAKQENKYVRNGVQNDKADRERSKTAKRRTGRDRWERIERRQAFCRTGIKTAGRSQSTDNNINNKTRL